MSALIRALGWTAALAIAVFVWIILAGREVRNYRCSGNDLLQEGEPAAMLFLEYSRYRFPVTLWADFDGMLVAEVPHGSNGLFHVTDIGPTLILKDFGDGPGGYWSKLSSAIDVELRLGAKAQFKGSCEPLDWESL